MPEREAIWTDFHRDLTWVFIAEELEQEHHSIGIFMDRPYENQFSSLHQVTRSHWVLSKGKIPSDGDLSSQMTKPIGPDHSIFAPH